MELTRELVQASAWARSLKPKSGAVAAVLLDGATEFVILGHGVDATTPIEIGSVTKGFTGLLLGQALERRELALDTRMDEALFGTRWPGEPAITVGTLATHTSGLPRLSMPPQVALLGDPYRWFGRDHLRRYLLRKQPRGVSEPKFAYSNLGFAVLGLMLERASGKPYAELLQELVLTPLQLQETGLQTVETGDLVAGGYNMFGWRAIPWHFRGYAPCGALVSTARDLLRAAQALADPAGPLPSVVALSTQRRADVPGGSIGLAWLRPKGSDWVWHNGGTFGYQAFVAFLPGRETAVALLANQYGSKPLMELARNLMRHLRRESPAAGVF